MARRSSGFVQDLRDADKALSSILPKVEAFAGLLGGLSAQPTGSGVSALRGQTLSSMGGGGAGLAGIRSRSGRGSGGGGTGGGGGARRASPRIGGGGYVSNIQGVTSGRTYQTGGAASTAPAQVTAGEAEIVNVLGAVVTELKKIRTGSDADGLRLRIGGQS